MELSIFLAKIFGLYLLIVSLAMFIRRDKFEKLIKAFEDDSAVLSLAMVMALILGLLLIVGHNVWVLAWPVIITILGWLIFLKGVTNLFFPKAMKSVLHLIQQRSVYLLNGGVCFLLAVFLICKGFF